MWNPITLNELNRLRQTELLTEAEMQRKARGGWAEQPETYKPIRKPTPRPELIWQ